MKDQGPRDKCPPVVDIMSLLLVLIHPFCGRIAVDNGDNPVNNLKNKDFSCEYNALINFCYLCISGRNLGLSVELILIYRSIMTLIQYGSMEVENVEHILGCLS